MTLSQIYTQQVLNNLAMFVQNPDALPFFAFPNQGTTQIQDTGNIGNIGYLAPNFMSDPFTLNASRQTSENWVLVPVSDPDKLKLMRCAYREAIASTIGVNRNDNTACPDCQSLRSDFYGPDGSDDGKPDGGEKEPCLKSPPWFQWGCKKHARLPKTAPCQYVGYYCGVYVCVPPEGREMLTRLTLAILDYAVNDSEQYQKRTKQVEIYLDKDGEPTTAVNAVKRIIATIPIDEPSNSLAVLDKSAAAAAFVARFGRKMASELLAEARSAGVSEGALVTLKYWKAVIVTEYPVRFREALKFLQENELRPQDIPSAQLLKGPAAIEKKGAANAGLQLLQQQLNAAQPR
jgi:hypothetical protein